MFLSVFILKICVPIKFRITLLELGKQRRHVARVHHALHFGVGRALAETAGGVKDEREQVNVAHGIEENTRSAQYPVNSSVNVGLFAQRFIPSIGIARLTAPRTHRNALDGLDRDIALLTGFQQRFQVGNIFAILLHHIVVGQENGIQNGPSCAGGTPEYLSRDQ